jgi:putative inorganic carbon (HCO3(-)) transporter
VGAQPTTFATTLSPTVVAVALIAALGVIAALTLLMRRRPEALPLLAIFALPFRLPISADGRTVNLLIPLYLVVGAGTLAYLLPLLGSDERSPADGDGRAVRSHGGPSTRSIDERRASPSPRGRVSLTSPRGLEWLLLGAVVLYALQAAYSGDYAKAAENIAFFYLPFGLLFLLLRDVHWTFELLLACLGVAVALAVVFAGVGFVEYYR